MINIFSGLLLSYLYSYLILPKNEGDEPNIKVTIYPIFYKGMVIIPYSKKKAIHLHHWITSIFIIVSTFKINDILFGFLLGLFLQGIQYKDRFEIICANPY